MRETTAVSIRADRVYIKALKELAEDKAVTVGELMRRLVDKEYGDALKPYLKRAAKRDHKSRQLSTEVEREHAAN